MQISLLRGRRPLEAAASPMAVPLVRDPAQRFSARAAAILDTVISRTRTDTARRVVSLALVALCVGLLAVVYLVQTSHVASLAAERADLEQHTTRVRDANARLSAQVAQAQSLERAESVARASGLRPATTNEVRYLRLPEVVEPPAEATAVPTARPSQWQRIADGLRGRAHGDAPLPALAPPMFGPPVPPVPRVVPVAVVGTPTPTLTPTPTATPSAAPTALAPSVATTRVATPRAATPRPPTQPTSGGTRP